jgi:hypothetical protein
MPASSISRTNGDAKCHLLVNTRNQTLSTKAGRRQPAHRPPGSAYQPLAGAAESLRLLPHAASRQLHRRDSARRDPCDWFSWPEAGAVRRRSRRDTSSAGWLAATQAEPRLGNAEAARDLRWPDQTARARAPQASLAILGFPVGALPMAPHSTGARKQAPTGMVALPRPVAAGPCAAPPEGQTDLRLSLSDAVRGSSPSCVYIATRFYDWINVPNDTGPAEPTTNHRCRCAERQG